MKIYTKKGDHGTTSLIGGERVAKDDPRVEAYGTVDELGAFVALLREELTQDDLRDDLLRILKALMAVGGSLAGGAGVPETETAWLESRIDALSETLPPLTRFTVPGGARAIALAHVCRTVCRRAERSAIRAKTTNTAALTYLNRLSDYFYILGRTLTGRLGVEELYY
jgi:cob(I)alamin adenosyltransferase